MNIKKLNSIKSKIHQSRNRQIGNVRFDEDTYKKIEEVAKGFKVTKQWLIQQIVTDFFIN
jgi:hypothetical protein